MHGYNGLFNYHLILKHYEFFEKYKTMDPQGYEENTAVIREMLYRVIEVRLRPAQTPDFKRRVEFADSARVLINTGEGFVAKHDPAEETKHLCSILAQLDLHPLFHTQFLQHLPDLLHSYSSDPSGVNTRFAIFEKLLAHDPNNPDLFGVLAAIFVRLDQSENYDQFCQQITNPGEYAHPPPLEEIIANTDLFANELRGPIRDKSRQLLAKI